MYTEKQLLIRPLLHRLVMSPLLNWKLLEPLRLLQVIEKAGQACGKQLNLKS